MKRKMLLFAIMVMAALSINAQDIKGTWVAAQDEMKIYFTFGDNGALNIQMTSEVDDEDFSAKMKFELPGSYSINDSKMNLVIDESGIKIKIDELKGKGENADTEELMKPLLEGALSENKGEITSDFHFDDVTIVSVSDDKLELKIEDEVTEFERVK